MSYWGAPPAYSLCGCWYVASQQKRYLPQVKLSSHTTILATTSSTNLKQTFSNPSNENLEEVTYTFPLYDGVSVAKFSCRIGEKTVVGVVKERNTARAEYTEAVSKGQTAALFEQNINSADVFTTSIGNVPRGEEVLIDITYLGELKNDAETDGARFTIPTQIAPRYGHNATAASSNAKNEGGIDITIDICLEEGQAIRVIQSSSHPISVTMGRTSMSEEDTFESHKASSSLTLGNTELDKDFIIVIQAKGQDTPRALLETHSTLPNQRAIMTTLVPRFNLPNQCPEIVFVVDRSGSMGGKMHLVIEALKVFLKSLPTSVKFNICSFGSRYSFLFERSRTYDATSLQTAMEHIKPNVFDANYGGTEMLAPVQEVIKRRYNDMNLEVLLLTDGEIWQQDQMFATVNTASEDRVRFFTLGIGSSASSSLVEGIARAGKGFSQWVNDGERIDKRIVRMLKAALTPHVEYRLEVKYAQSDPTAGEDFEFIESFEKSLDSLSLKSNSGKTSVTKRVISLFNSKSRDEPTNPAAGRYDHLPDIPVPNVLQTPHNIRPLYPHSRSTIYLLLGPNAPLSTPTSVILHGKSGDDDLELELPVQGVGRGTTIHQLAAKKATQELEEGRGWISKAKDEHGRLVKTSKEGRWDLLVEREAARLGTTFQVGGKYCSFVAVLRNGTDSELKLADQVSVSSDLRDYQEGLMVLHQDNKNRRRMFKQAAHIPLGSATLNTVPQSSSIGGVFGGAARGGYGSGSISTSRGATSSTGDIFARSVQNLGYGGPPPPAPRASASFMASAPGGAITASNARRSSTQRKSDRYEDTSASSATDQHPPRMAHYSGSPALMFGSAGPVIDPSQFSSSPNQPFNLNSSTLQNEDVLENFDFDSFLKTDANDSFDFGSNNASTQDASQQAMFGAQYASRKSTGANAPSKPLSSFDKMQRLIDLQSFTGQWNCTPELLGILSCAGMNFSQEADVVKTIRGVADTVLGEDYFDRFSIQVLMTSLIVAWFEAVVPDEVEVWEMVVDKAKDWLEGNMDGSHKVEVIVKTCKKIYRE